MSGILGNEAVYDLLDRLQVGENDEFEGKLARGGIPSSIWPTVSAFANTSGGILILGLEETSDGWKIEGIADPASMIKDLHSQFRNQQKISAEVVRPDDIRIEALDDKSVIVIRVPASARRYRPVYVDGRTDRSFVRRGEGDHRCSADEIARMFREAIPMPSDIEVLPFLGYEHLNPESIRRFRSRCRVATPELPFNDLPDQDFLERVGVFRHDLESDKRGLTRAGALMLGTEVAIREIRPSHQLDYRFRALDQDVSTRWTDREIWNGNLLDFYEIVSVRLLRSLPTPFQLSGDQRIDEPMGRIAIRESLVNMLVHADYAEGASSVVELTAEGIALRNPGASRVPDSELLLGGRSDERNPTLSRLFRQAGLAEQAGSGLTKIFDAWKRLKYRVPEFRSDGLRHEFSVDLRFVHLFSPPDREWLGTFEQSLNEPQELAMVLALHGGVDNQTLRATAGIHAADATTALRGLREMGFLSMLGERRGAKYILGRNAPSFPLHVGGVETNKTTGDKASSATNDTSFTISPNDPANTATNETAEHYKDEFAVKLEELRPQLEERALPVLERRRVSPEVAEEVVYQLCLITPLRIHDLSVLTNRGTNRVRQIVQTLTRRGWLKPIYESTHPRQRYMANRRSEQLELKIGND